MKITHTIADIKHTIASYKSIEKTIAFVPTMGNLHQGHLELIKMASRQADIVVCSIFVNPLQFGKGEDFEQYPRTLETDIEQLKNRACDVVFAPTVNEMYPDSNVNGQDNSQLMVPVISDILEGASRPGHFMGVATIVAKLFNIIQPHKAIFGAKDYQQLQVIKQFVQDLCFPVEILAHPIVRQNNGLALSSRNKFLSNTQKQQAGIIFQTLKNLADQIKSGETKFAQLEQNAIQLLDAQGFKTDYISIRKSDLSPATLTDKKLVILIATYLANTRLLDNLQIER
ncbi:MAG: pantoate--beta-alanine ligase [Gammaproteobacteria bacterium]|nr:pantoate--beta-alanine ligase [Gammaproteobacteria bacterium]